LRELLSSRLNPPPLIIRQEYAFPEEARLFGPHSLWEWGRARAIRRVNMALSPALSRWRREKDC
jgi:hypothetical protein